MSINVTIKREYKMGYINGRVYTLPHMFAAGMYTNGRSYVLAETVYVKNTWTRRNCDILDHTFLEDMPSYLY